MAEKGQMSSLEERMQELEALTSRLESGQMSIDEAIASYTKGMDIALSCRKSLDEMTQKISVARQKSQALMSSGQHSLNASSAQDEVAEDPGDELTF
ncbi:MAG: exodeoxyribonuclease VII small subunit [Succinivibrio sp.]|nr:exodeoxyribonuclease VII small subunit [Succinivibrio sp.]